MDIYSNDNLLEKGSAYPIEDFTFMQFDWKTNPNFFYTLIMRKKSTSKFNYFVINIPGNVIDNGSTVIDFFVPEFDLTKKSTFYVEVYEQEYLLTQKILSQSLEKIIKENDIALVYRVSVIVDPKNNSFYIENRNQIPNASIKSRSPRKSSRSPRGSSKSPSKNKSNNVSPVRTRGRPRKTVDAQKSPRKTSPKPHVHTRIIKKTSPLTERQKKYCSCVVQVAEKQNDNCLSGKNWRKTVDGKQCYNPYAVCAKSTGGGNKNCGDNYNYNKMTNAELMKYRLLSGKINI